MCKRSPVRKVLPLGSQLYIVRGDPDPRAVEESLDGLSVDTLPLAMPTADSHKTSNPSQGFRPQFSPALAHRENSPFKQGPECLTPHKFRIDSTDHESNSFADNSTTHPLSEEPPYSTSFSKRLRFHRLLAASRKFASTDSGDEGSWPSLVR